MQLAWGKFLVCKGLGYLTECCGGGGGVGKFCQCKLRARLIAGVEGCRHRGGNVSPWGRDFNVACNWLSFPIFDPRTILWMVKCNSSFLVTKLGLQRISDFDKASWWTLELRFEPLTSALPVHSADVNAVSPRFRALKFSPLPTRHRPVSAH